jgi:hypothetical protein
MVTVIELQRRMVALDEGAKRTLEQLKENLSHLTGATKAEIDNDRKIIDSQLKKEKRGKVVSRLTRRGAKHEKAVGEMTHDARVKELAAKGANYSLLAYKAERDKEPEDKRIGSLMDELLKQEEEELKDETEMGSVLEELEDTLNEIHTDPGRIDKLTPAKKRDNIRAWAQVHAQMQKLGVLQRDIWMKQSRIERLRAEVMPLIKHETDTDTKIEKLLDWVRKVEEEERVIEEQEAKKTQKGAVDVKKFRDAA